MYGVLPLPRWSQRWFDGDAAGRELTRHTTAVVRVSLRQYWAARGKEKLEITSFSFFSRIIYRK